MGRLGIGNPKIEMVCWILSGIFPEGSPHDIIYDKENDVYIFELDGQKITVMMGRIV